MRRAITEIGSHVHIKLDSALVSTAGGSLESILLSSNGIVSKIDHEVTSFDIENIEKQLVDSAGQKSKKIIWDNIVEVKVDGKVLSGNPEGTKGVKLELKKLFVYISSQQNDLIDTLLYENGIEMIRIFPKGIHASKLGLTEKQKIVGVGYLDIGAETTTLTVYENGSIIGYQLIPIGSNDITNDIALGLKISLDEAELVKYGASTQIFPKKKIDDIVNSRLEDICELTNSYLKKIKRYELLPGGLILNGGGAEVIGIEERLRKSLNLPIKKINFEIVTQKKGVIKHSEYLESYSLALTQYDIDQSEGKRDHGSLLYKIKHGINSLLKQFLP